MKKRRPLQGVTRASAKVRRSRAKFKAARSGAIAKMRRALRMVEALKAKFAKQLTPLSQLLAQADADENRAYELWGQSIAAGSKNNLENVVSAVSENLDSAFDDAVTDIESELETLQELELS